MLKSVFSLPSTPIEIGKKANITLFTDQGEWVMNKKDIISSSKNCAFVGEKLQRKSTGRYHRKGTVARVNATLNFYKKYCINCLTSRTLKNLKETTTYII